MIVKNFIVPIDFSEESYKGLELAILFSKYTHVNIQMVHVLRKSSDLSPASVDVEAEQAEITFKKIVEKHTPRLGNNSNLRYISKKGKIYQEVVNQAQSYKDSVITASTHGLSGFEEFFIGSNAYKIILATDRPVITIRKGKCPEDIKKIVLPIDTGEDTRQKVPFTTELAQLLGAEVHIIAVNSNKDDKAINKLRAYSTQVAGYMVGKVSYATEELFGENISDLIVNYAKAVKADLISIMTEQSPGISLILGNTAHQVINKAEIPVLSITPRELKITGGSFKTFGD
ncbi:MAG: universal stress protein [Bacteroidales bacterium]|nr:universal stress protein [Bacteroidales bacterium]